MSAVSNLSVSIEGKIDIVDQVKVININESLLGELSASLEIIDGVGLLDSAIGSGQTVIISYTYLSVSIANAFIIDGVQAIDVTSSKTRKTYIIKLVSPKSITNSLQLISKSYRGLATDIVKNIHDEFYGTDTLDVLAQATNHGHYIAPNISPETAINRILSNAYDADNNPFFIFQQVISKGKSILNSLKNIEKQIPSIEISPTILDIDTIDKPLSTIGQPQQVIIHSDGDNTAYKISKGLTGKTIINLDISNSSLKKESLGVHTNSNSIIAPLRLDRFNSEEKPLLNGGDSINYHFMKIKRESLFDNRVTAYRCTAIPNLGVGNKVRLILDRNSIKSGVSKYTGNYVVYGIHHIIEDGIYTQNVEMTRG